MLGQAPMPTIPRPTSFEPKSSAPASIRADKAQATSNPKSTSWKVDAESVPFLPSYVPLERAHVWLKQEQCSTVAQRIAECMKKESIAATYDDGKAIAYAETGCDIKFNIRFFKQEGKGVVVELQKRSGCCIGFREIAKTVLRAGMGRKPRTKRTFCVPKCLLSEERLNADLEDALDLAANLLREERIDANTIGLRTLVQMTTDAALDSAQYIAEKIATEKSMCELIVAHIHSKPSKQNVEDNDHTAEDQMRRYALTVFGNCLASLVAGDKVSSLSGSFLESEEMVNVLVETIAAAEERPHDACQSLRCLNILMLHSGKVAASVSSLGIQNLVMNAYNEGACRHSKLEEESAKLQTQIGTV